MSFSQQGILCIDQRESCQIIFPFASSCFDEREFSALTEIASEKSLSVIDDEMRVCLT